MAFRYCSIHRIGSGTPGATKADLMAIRLHPGLIRAARGLLNWSVAMLAQKAGLSASTVRRMEMTGPQSISFSAYMQVRLAFEQAGVRFLDDNGEGIGLRFKPR